MSPRWPQIRAVLIALHVVAVLVGALPAPQGAMKRAAWKDASVQAELDTWHARLAVVAPGLDRATFEDRLWTLASRWNRTYEALGTPFQPYYRIAGAEQSWRMFVAPHRFPAKLWIELQDTPDADFRPIYVTRSPEYRWLGGQLDADRFRSVLFRCAWPQYAKSYAALGEWLADRAARQFPHAVALRTRWYRYRTPSPAEVLEHREPEGAFERERIYPLGPRRAATSP